jgi:nicotinamidase-related amidase
MAAPELHPADIPLEDLVDPARSAPVFVDVTNDFCHRDGHFARTANDMTRIDALIDPLARVLEAARSFGVTIVHLQNTVLAGGASPHRLRMVTPGPKPRPGPMSRQLDRRPLPTGGSDDHCRGQTPLLPTLVLSSAIAWCRESR